MSETKRKYTVTPAVKRANRIRATKHGRHDSPVYSSWKAMITRCVDPRCASFKNYGAKGIKVCERWNKFENFLEDMGDTQKGMTIDRIENDKGYYKKNCRWATRSEQNRHRKNGAKFIMYKGEIKIIKEWAEHFGICRHLLARRLHWGWPLEKAFSKKDFRYVREN